MDYSWQMDWKNQKQIKLEYHWCLWNLAIFVETSLWQKNLYLPVYYYQWLRQQCQQVSTWYFFRIWLILILTEYTTSVHDNKPWKRYIYIEIKIWKKKTNLNSSLNSNSNSTWSFENDMRMLRIRVLLTQTGWSGYRLPRTPLGSLWPSSLPPLQALSWSLPWNHTYM